MKKKIIIASITLFVSLLDVVQAQIGKPTSSAVQNFTAINRSITISEKDKKQIILLDAKPGEGVAWADKINFSTGTIEFDVKGKDVAQQSFVGIAFHGINDSTYEAVYFRPFNFQSFDTTKRNHSVQYISMPRYDWSYLRETQPGKYENVLLRAVNPNEWFHVKIVISKNEIKAFVNKDDMPSLVVQPISQIVSGKIGFWVGNDSDGAFSNLMTNVN